MNVNRLKNLVIKHSPQTLTKSLRKYRVLKEGFFYFFSLLGFTSFKIYKLKYQKSSKYYSSQVSDLKLRWGEAFCDYKGNYDETVRLIWSDGPIPGNYGDWLSPYIISKVAGVNIKYISEAVATNKPHLVGLGSIASCANKHSVILSSGVTSKKIKLNPSAKYISVRGEYTNNQLKDSGHPGVKNFGDIGFLLSRVYQPRKIEKTKKYLLVRHIQHINLDIFLTNDFEEVSIYAAKPKDIEYFIDKINSAEVVYTSAMHCYITCISYGIPCVLFKVGNTKSVVPGDGVKYIDALNGVGLKEVDPIVIDYDELNNFPKVISQAPLMTNKVTKETLDNIQNSILEAVSLVKY